MILLVDNYDSFTYNLYQYIGHFTKDIVVKRNDTGLKQFIATHDVKQIIISPGPKTPSEAGECIELIEAYYDKLPILGICLGHQCIGQVFGANIRRADTLYHGKASEVTYNDSALFTGINKAFKAARYHSLVVEENAESKKHLEVTAKTKDGTIMAMKHKTYPVIGLQFHPESIETPDGMRLIENFLKGVY